jgi:hypothetical protein
MSQLVKTKLILKILSDFGAFKGLVEQKNVGGPLVQKKAQFTQELIK